MGVKICQYYARAALYAYFHARVCRVTRTGYLLSGCDRSAGLCLEDAGLVGHLAEAQTPCCEMVSVAPFLRDKAGFRSLVSFARRIQGLEYDAPKNREARGADHTENTFHRMDRAHCMADGGMGKLASDQIKAALFFALAFYFRE